MSIVEIVLINIIIILSFLIGYFFRKHIYENRKNKRESLTKEEKERQQKIQKSFEELMDYDYSHALGGDKQE